MFGQEVLVHDGVLTEYIGGRIGNSIEAVDRLGPLLILLGVLKA